MLFLRLPSSFLPEEDQGVFLTMIQLPAGATQERMTPETFLPRIHVIKGVNISTATVCRQCEDAPCANVCPNGAISRDKGFVHVMQERCNTNQQRVVLAGWRSTGSAATRACFIG